MSGAEIWLGDHTALNDKQFALNRWFRIILAYHSYVSFRENDISA